MTGRKQATNTPQYYVINEVKDEVVAGPCSSINDAEDDAEEHVTDPRNTGGQFIIVKAVRRAKVQGVTWEDV